MKIALFRDDYDYMMRSQFEPNPAKLPRLMFVFDENTVSIPMTTDERIERFIATVETNRTVYPKVDLSNVSEEEFSRRVHNGLSFSTEGEFPVYLNHSFLRGEEYFGWDSNSIIIGVSEGKCYISISQHFNHDYERSVDGKSHSVASITINLPNDELVAALKLYLKEKPLFKDFK